MNNAYEIRTQSAAKKSYMGRRQWSSVARWTFREYNELPHMLDRRLAPSYKHAEDYLKLFTQSEVVTAMARVCGFVSGSLIAVLFLFTAIDESILLHVKVANQNLLWYVGVLGIIFGASKSLQPDETLHSTIHTINLVRKQKERLKRSEATSIIAALRRFAPRWSRWCCYQS